ncbi:Sex-determining protein fem-1 [Fusarium austroafricanum]|uniref:Sex-determining protein fem-1 n=1 Tax=Fusarium austroafricanum TaxID=2364996 RepID=A0A8H4JND3_9HYPO|nr:Sex-determining protein fem-1 [Fusarium austroafricanum]
MNPQDSQLMASRPPISEEQWIQYKEFIRYQYLMRGISLQELVKFLSCLGFRVTTSQLQFKLKAWKISKNMDKPTWQYIGRKVTKRKAEGKDTDVIHCGKRLKQTAVNKGITRHSEQNIFVLMAQSRSPPPSPTNPYLTVCTPPSLQMEFEWPVSLPWMKFQNTYQALAFNLHRRVNARIDLDAIPRMLQHDLFRQYHGDNPLANASKMAANICKTIPEWYEGEHIQTTQILLHGSEKDAMPHCLKLIIYQLSNGLHKGFKSHHEWVEFYDLLMGLDILDLQIDIRLLSDDEITIAALLETLFEYAIEWAAHPISDPTQSFDLLKWLLKSGQDPNKKMRRKRWSPLMNMHRCWRPVELAIIQGRIELLELLLGSVSCRDFFGMSALKLTLQTRHPDDIKIGIIHLLIRYDTSLSREEVLHAAIKLRDLNLINSMLKTAVYLTSTMEVDHSRVSLYEETVLSAAITAGSDVTATIFNYIALLDPSKLRTPFVTADTFIAAAGKGDDAIINRLHEIDPTVGNTCNPRGIKPVQVAVSAGHPSTCRLLLSLYGGYSPALLFLAAYLGHGDIFQFLLDEGADANESIPPEDLPECARVCDDLMDYSKGKSLPSVFATLLHVCPDPTDFYYVRTLIENGARLTGSEICNLAETAPVDILLAALTHGSSANERDARGKSALEFAIDSVWTDNDDPEYSVEVKRRLQAVEALLQHGAKRYTGEIVSVIRYEDPDLLTLVLRHHPGWKDTDENGVTSLEAAIAFSGCGIISPVTAAYKGYYDPSSLCAAAQAKNLPLVELLLANRPIQSDYHVLEGTAVGLVAMSGHLDYLQLLAEYLPEAKEANSALLPIYSGFQEANAGRVFLYDKPLFWRYSKTYYECVHGSPLALASLGSDMSGFKYLLRKGYNADLHTWITIANLQRLPHLELLANYQQRLDKFPPTSSVSPTALCAAVSLGNEVLVQCLLNAGADINEYGIGKWRLGRSPLQISVESGNLELMSCLLHKGANINAPPTDESGATALQLAAIGGHLGIARELLDRGARVNARGAKIHGRTSLEGAAEHGRHDMLELLICYGALITGNGRGQFIRAVMFAMDEGFYVAANLLKRRGGWTDEDERRCEDERQRLKGHNLADSTDYCCDVIHNPDTKCIYEPTKTEEESYCFEIMPHPGPGFDESDSEPESGSDSGHNDEEYENVEALSDKF